MPYWKDLKQKVLAAGLVTITLVQYGMQMTLSYYHKSAHGLRRMTNVCKEFEIEYGVQYNPKKTVFYMQGKLQKKSSRSILVELS